METFVGDTVEIILETGIDLSAYTNLYIIYEKPDGTCDRWDATIVAGEPTQMSYTTEEDDLDIAGNWRLQAQVDDALIDLHGLWCDLKVYRPLCEFV